MDDLDKLVDEVLADPVARRAYMEREAERFDAVAAKMRELEWLLENATGPTHMHSTDMEPGCKACEWDRRLAALKKGDGDG